MMAPKKYDGSNSHTKVATLLQLIFDPKLSLHMGCGALRVWTCWCETLNFAVFFLYAD
jgi:hypothetical protein